MFTAWSSYASHIGQKITVFRRQNSAGDCKIITWVKMRLQQFDLELIDNLCQFNKHSFSIARKRILVLFLMFLPIFFLHSNSSILYFMYVSEIYCRQWVFPCLPVIFYVFMRKIKRKWKRVNSLVAWMPRKQKKFVLRISVLKLNIPSMHCAYGTFVQLVTSSLYVINH